MTDETTPPIDAPDAPEAAPLEGSESDPLRPTCAERGQSAAIAGLHNVRGGADSFHKAQRAKVRRAAKSDPAVALAATAAGIIGPAADVVADVVAEAAKPKRRGRGENFRNANTRPKGGRPKGKRTMTERIRAESERAALNALQAMNRGGAAFFDKLRDTAPYLLIQHVKPAAPKWTPDPKPEADARRTLTLTFADEGPDGTRIDSPEAQRYAELLGPATSPATMPAVTSEGIDPAQQAPAASMQHAASCCPTSEADSTPSVDTAPDTVNALIRMARMGDVEARSVIDEAARRIDAERQAKARDAERKRVEREREANRRAVYNNPNAWSAL